MVLVSSWNPNFSAGGLIHLKGEADVCRAALERKPIGKKSRLYPKIS